MASKNPADDFLGKPKKPDLNLEEDQKIKFRLAVLGIVDEVIDGGNWAFLVKEKQKDAAFKADVGKLASQLGDKVRHELIKRGII